MARTRDIAVESPEELDELPLARILRLMGGSEVFRKRAITSQFDVHDMIIKGLPGGSLMFMVKHMETLKPADVSRAVGVSVRTVQRRKGKPQKALSKDQSGRAWKFAEILTNASEVFGSQAEAERWLASPAMALDQRRPVDMLTTPAGVEMVQQLLGRLAHGVYT